ncbi:hypothetical protein C2G38_2205862 [Gigaspora rosea]|uniref:Uncharacterized protein n=1 Tax=Gigaspora rosea TaxID=44941 RepID=A0A397UJR6_9GLOM|nr:hypothetical protein C2G38_2205862 [Gigaspora rosea]
MFQDLPNAAMVIVEQNTPLNILTLGNFSTIYDLSISPAFGVFTGHVQDASTIEDAYDSVTLSKQENWLRQQNQYASFKWSNPKQNSPKTSNNKQILKDKKYRNEDLKELAKKFDKSPSNNSTQRNPTKK